MLKIGPFFGQTRWNFPLDLSNNGAIESNSHYNKFISRKKESIKCPTAMSTSGKPLYMPLVCDLLPFLPPKGNKYLQCHSIIKRQQLSRVIL